MVKNLTAMQTIQVRSLGWEDPLEEGMTLHSSILAWRIPSRRAWWNTVHEVAESWIQLREKQCNLSNSILMTVFPWCHRSQGQSVTVGVLGLF